MCFADDTALYLQGDPDNLDKAYVLLEAFCGASGSKVNWDKTFGVWAANSPRTCSWGEDLGLKWLAEGEVTKYLGFPFGLNISQADKDAKILLQIRSKLQAWSGKKLSLAARVLVSNQVVFASIWYFCSCSDVSKTILFKARSLVRNFIWGGAPDKKTRAKVAWNTAIIPTIKGSLKVFDPYTQARALLAKILVRALAPGSEPWKTL